MTPLPRVPLRKDDSNNRGVWGGLGDGGGIAVGGGVETWHFECFEREGWMKTEYEKD